MQKWILLKAEYELIALSFGVFVWLVWFGFFIFTHLNRSYHLLICENRYPEVLAPE